MDLEKYFGKKTESEDPCMSTEVIVSADYTRAVTITRTIIANAQAAQQSLYEVCKGLKEMKDGKLYKELGYQNFEEYCENEVGISRMHAYRYAAIADGLSEDFVTSCYKIGVTKLELLAKLDEPTRQEITEHVDVESVTVKELKAEVAALQDGKKQAEAQLSQKDKQFRAAMESKQNEFDDFREGAKRRQDNLMKKIGMLNEKIKELEERPIEHDMVDNAEELERLRQQLAEAQRQLAEKPMVQDALPVMPTEVIDSKGEFKAYLTTAADNLKRLCAFIEQHRHDRNLPLFLEKTSGILGFANSELARLKGGA